MPEIAAAPSPVIAPPSNGTAAATAHNDSAANALPDAGGNTSADPFSAMLQRMVKGKSDQTTDQTSTRLALLTQGAEAKATGNDAAMNSLMASLQAQMLGLRPDSTGKGKDLSVSDELQTAVKDEGLSAPQDTNTQSVLGSLLAASTASTSTSLNKEAANDGQPGQRTIDDGKTEAGLAAKAAILALGDASEGQAAHQTQDADDFQALLESARNLQTGNQPVQTQSHAVAASRTEVRVETPVGHPQWGQEVGDKVAWMVGKQESRAELVLNPPQMGRIEVSITLTGDQASAAFNTSNPAVREALESALPRLREVLADAGVRLDQAQVGSDNRGDTPQQQERRDNSGRNDKVANGDMIPGLASAASGTSRWVQQGNGMVDTFA